MHHAIGACVEQRHQVSRLKSRQFAVTRKKIARLADRSHDIHYTRLARARPHRNNLVMCLVKCGADQVVHCRINHNKGLFAVALHMEHTCHKRPSLSHQKAPRLQQQPALKAAQRLLNGRRIAAHVRLRVEISAVVVNAEPTTRVDGLQHNALARKLAHHAAYARNRRAKGLRRADLRSDVHAHAMRLKPAMPRHALVDRRCAAYVDAEFMLAQPGGYIRMRLGKDIGIDAQGKPRQPLVLARARGQQLQLRFALHVELEDAGFKRQINLRRRLAHAGEDHTAGGLGRRRQHALQFTAGDDIEPRAARSQQLENRQRGVGLHRVADQVVAPR